VGRGAWASFTRRSNCRWAARRHQGLPAHALLDPGKLSRFQREAGRRRSLHHTKFVPVFGVGEQDGCTITSCSSFRASASTSSSTKLRCMASRGGTKAPTRDDVPDSPTESHPERLRGGRWPAPCSPEHSASPSRPGPDDRAERGEPGRVKRRGPRGALIGPRGDDTSATIHLPGQSGASTLSESGGQYCRAWRGWACKVADALPMPASRGSCTATSSPPTCCSTTRATVG